MADTKDLFVRTEDGSVYGPADVASLVEWAKDGRIDPSSFVSSDRINWLPAQLMPELEMKWLVETEPGKFFGPFHRQVVSSLFHEGQLPQGAKAYRLHEFPIDEDPPPVVKVVEKIVEVERPARTQLIVPEVVEPAAKAPPPCKPGSLFGGMDRERMAALEAAVQGEIVRGKKLGFSVNLFGSKKK